MLQLATFRHRFALFRQTAGDRVAAPPLVTRPLENAGYVDVMCVPRKAHHAVRLMHADAALRRYSDTADHRAPIASLLIELQALPSTAIDHRDDSGNTAPLAARDPPDAVFRDAPLVRRSRSRPSIGLLPGCQPLDLHDFISHNARHLGW
jgi:hypothetical protein